MKTKLIATLALCLLTGCVTVNQRDPVTIDNVKHAREVYARDSTAAPEIKEAHDAFFKEWLEYEDEAKRDK